MHRGEAAHEQSLDGNDFFMSATAAFHANDVDRRSPFPSLYAQQMRLTQANVLAQSLRAEALQSGQLVARTALAASPLTSPCVSEACAGEATASTEEKGREGTQSAYLPVEVATQRMIFVAELSARMQERARVRGRRPSSMAHVSGPVSVTHSRSPVQVEGSPRTWGRSSLAGRCVVGQRFPRSVQEEVFGLRRLCERTSQSPRGSAVRVPEA